MTVIETEERETSSQLERDSAMTTGGWPHWDGAKGNPHFPAPSVFSGSAKQGNEARAREMKAREESQTISLCAGYYLLIEKHN